MSNAYQEIAKNMRQGSMSAANWAAYLRQQQQQKASYNSAVQAMQQTAASEGAYGMKAEDWHPGMNNSDAQTRLNEYGDRISSALAYYDLDTQLKSLYQTAKSNGISVPYPVEYGKSVKDSNTAQTILNNYISKINIASIQQSAKSAISDLQSQARSNGLNIHGIPDSTISDLRTEAQATELINSYAAEINNQLLKNSVSSAINSIASQANAAGVYSTAPVVSGNLTSEQAQKVVDDYAARVNQLILEKNVSDQLASLKTQAQSLGVTVATPSVTGITSSTAQSVLDSYVSKVNAALAAQVQTTYTYTVYDELGRSYSISQSQYNQLKKWQSKNTANNTYNVIPEEVANSGSNWWINDQGFYEWTPTTAGDKAHLDNINYQRSQSGLSPWKTLQTSAAETSAYKQWEEDTAHQDQRTVGTPKKLTIIPNVASSVERSGTNNIGESSVRLFTSTLTASELKTLHQEYLVELATGNGPVGAASVFHNDNYDLTVKAEKAQAAADLKALEAARAAYQEAVTVDGKTLDAVQKVGAESIGEKSVTVYTQDSTGKILSRSGTASEYATALANAKKIGSLTITASTSVSDAKKIQDARDYYNTHASTSIDFEPKTALKESITESFIETKLSALADTLKAVSKAGTQGEAAANYLKNIATNDLSLTEDVGSVIQQYTSDFQKIVTLTDKGLTEVPSMVVNELKALNTLTEKNYGSNLITQKVSQTLDTVQKSGKSTIDTAVLSAINLSPLDTLNEYVKTNYGTSSITQAVDLTTDVARAIPTNVYKDITEKPASTAIELATLTAIGAAFGAGMGVLKTGEIKLIETALKDEAGAKAIAKTVGTGIEAVVQGKLTYDVGKQTYDTVKTGDATKIADFATEFAIGGYGYSGANKYFEGKLAKEYSEGLLNSYNPLSRLAKIAGESTGLVRGKVVVIENKPYHPVESQAALISAVIDKDTISGTRGTAVYRFLQPVKDTSLGIETFTLPGSKKEYTLGTTLRKLAGIQEQTLTRFKTEGGTAKDQAYVYASDVYSSYMVPDLTEGNYGTVGGHFLQKSGKSKINQEVQLFENIETVASELSALQKAAIKAQYAESGKLDPSLVHEVQRLASEKSARIGQPVATITPKTAAGAKPEAEVLLVFGSPESTYRTDSKIVGITSSGVKIKKLRYGTQAAIDSELSILSNLKYNWSNRLTGSGKYVEGMSKAINRKIAEESGNAFMKLNQYDARGAHHGVQHTGRVAEIMADLWYKSPTLQKKYTLKEFEVAGRLHDAARIYGNSKMGETEPISHGPAVAKAVRAGLIKDSALNSLTRKQQLNVASAIDTHMWLKPSSKLQRVTYWASDIQKALKTADSLARGEEKGYLIPGTTFKLPEETTGYKLKSVLSSFGEGVQRLNQDTIAELAPRRAKIELESLDYVQKSAENKVSELNESIKTDSFKTKTKIESDYSYKNNSSAYKGILGASALSFLPAYTASASDLKNLVGLYDYGQKLSSRYGLASNYRYINNGYTPKSGNYTPKSGSYVPKSGSYVPSSGVYIPKSGNYTPSNGNYTPTPGNYVPRNSGYTPGKKYPKTTPVIPPVGGGGMGSKVIPPTPKQKEVLEEKKKKAISEGIRSRNNLMKLQRQIQNVLGGLDSIMY